MSPVILLLPNPGMDWARHRAGYFARFLVDTFRVPLALRHLASSLHTPINYEESHRRSENPVNSLV
jgi:hypothetical protein